MDRALLEEMLAEGLSLAAMGRRLGVHESTVAGHLWKYGLRPVNAERHAARGGLTREQLEPLVAKGLSIAQIAAEVDRSKATVRHWLRRHGLKTWSPSGSRRKAESRRPWTPACVGPRWLVLGMARPVRDRWGRLLPVPQVPC